MDNCPENRTGFLSLPRELRDQIYSYWWEDRKDVHRNDDDGTWIPFEHPEKPAQPIRTKGVRTNRTIPKPSSPALLLNHPPRAEFLASAFHDLSLTLSIQHLAINEPCLAPWPCHRWTVPPTTLAHART